MTDLSVIDETAFQEWIVGQRWFGSKAREIRAARFSDWALSRRGAAPSFITTVQVIPALTNTPGGTCVIWTRTGMRCASRTQVNVGLIEERSSGPSLLSWSVMPLDMPTTVPCSAGDPSMR